MRAFLLASLEVLILWTGLHIISWIWGEAYSKLDMATAIAFLALIHTQDRPDPTVKPTTVEGQR